MGTGKRGGGRNASVEMTFSRHGRPWCGRDGRLKIPDIGGG